ncbi:MAG TPA: lysyl oxidase family protein [Acidimicrobiales bacterium]|nr:lysyl oxidase family protein [Acidimicrobiales bacterium]
MGDPSFRSTRRRRVGVLVAAAMLVSVLAVRASAGDGLDPYLGDPGRTLPNLVPNVVTVEIQPIRFTETGFEHGTFLWFDTRAQNLGTVPLQLTVEEIETPEISTVAQCVSWRLPEAHMCREAEPVGGFTWHAEHRHFHYTDFAKYEFRTLTPEGRPDYTDAGLLGLSEKVSFCLVDSQRVRDDARPTPLYQTCLPTVQGVSAGWTDIYTTDLPGQNFSVAGLPDGRYAVIIDMDYANTIRETDDTDNYVEVTVELSGMGTENPQAAVVDRRWPPPHDRGTPTTTTTTSKKKPKKLDKITDTGALQ